MGDYSWFPNQDLDRALADEPELPRHRRGVPGRRTLTAGLPPVLRAARADRALDDDAVRAALERARARSGSPIPAAIQRDFERSLGATLSSVRVHTDDAAAEAAEALDARAFALGQDVYFGAGQYDP